MSQLKKTRFRITIHEIGDEEYKKGHDWKVVEKRPYTPEELTETGDPEYYKQREKEVIDYTPEITSTRSVDRQIFEQVTDDLDLVSVIRAVNNIRSDT